MGKSTTARSFKKTATATVGMVLMGTSTFGGVAHALTTAEAAPQNFKNAVSAEEYAKTAQEVSIDYTSLDDAVKSAQDKGVKVATGDVKEVTVSTLEEAQKLKSEAEKARDASIAELKSAQSVNAENEQIAKRNADAKKDADAKNAAEMKRYEAEKAAQDKLYKEQVENADPNKAHKDVKNLAVEQPFEVLTSSNNLASINDKAPAGNTTDRSDFPNNFSSDEVYRFINLDGNNPNLKLKYTGAAVDKETGKKLDATVQVKRFVSNPAGSPLNADGSAKWNNMIDVYSSFNDIISYQKIYGMELEITFSDHDSGKVYNKPYYITIGSLNAQENQGETSAVRYELTAPGKNIAATFLNSESLIHPEAQTVHGTAAELKDKAFFIREGLNQVAPIDDESAEGEALEKIGVTYFVAKGGTASVFVGTTGNANIPGADGVTGDPQKTGVSQYSDYAIDASYTHLMLSANTVAPTLKNPVKPKLIEPKVEPLKPVPGVSVQKTVIKIGNVPPVKTVADEDIIIPAGNNLPTQTVTGTTGSKALDQFSITDLVEYAKDGDGNWRALVSITEDKLKVVDADGKDVTDLFDIKVEKGKLVSGTGTDFDGHVADVVTATAKKPGKLTVNSAYSLKVESKSLNDFKADEMRDLGIVTINNKPIVTSIHRVKEITGQVNKELTTPASEVKPGATLRWKAQAKNSSGADMEKAVISEFPDNAQFDVASVKFLNTNGRGVVNGNTWEIGELKAGETVEFEVEVTLKNDLDMSRVASEGILNTIVLTNNPTPEDPTPTNPPKECQVNTTVDEDTDGCDMTVTKVTPPPVTPETPKPNEPTEPSKPEQPKTIEKVTAETGSTGYGTAGLDARTAGGIGLLLLAGAGAGGLVVKRRRDAKASQES